MSADPAKRAWQSSVGETTTPPMAAVRAGASKFYRYVTWRNRVEYAACAVVVAIFGAYVVVLPHVLEKIGSVLSVLASLFVALQLHRRASAAHPDTAGAVPILHFARAQLVRQRNALRSVFGWYILPFLPGMALIVAGKAMTLPDGPGRPQYIALAVIAAIVGSVWWLNQVAARKLQRHIDDIDALIGAGE